MTRHMANIYAVVLVWASSIAGLKYNGIWIWNSKLDESRWLNARACELNFSGETVAMTNV